MWYEDGVPHRECVACGYIDKLDADGQSIPLGAGQDEVKALDTSVQSILIIRDSESEQLD
jgi:hypothetical protein